MQALTFFFAFVAVLALIGVVAWLIRQFAGNRIGANPNRGRMPRLAVIDAAAVDGRRRLVLVRRDNVEHLLMIGGPTDIVVEPNIVRATPARDQLPPRPAVAGPEPQPRVVPLPDVSGWSDAEGARTEPFDHGEPQMPEVPPRPARPPFADEVRRPAAAERRIDRDPLAGFAPEPMSGRPEPRGEPLAPRMAPLRSEPLIPRPPRSGEAPKPSREPSREPARMPERAAPPPPHLLLRLRLRRLHRWRRRYPRRTRILPRWPNGSRPRFAGQPAKPLRRRSRQNLRRRALRPAASRQLSRRPRERRPRAGLKTLKTRWHPCWAVRRTLREVAGSSA